MQQPSGLSERAEAKDSRAGCLSHLLVSYAALVEGGAIEADHVRLMDQVVAWVRVGATAVVHRLVRIACRSTSSIIEVRASQSQGFEP